MTTPAEAVAFVNAAKPALEHFFEALREHRVQQEAYRRQLSDLVSSLEQDFQLRGQWSSNANWHYGQLVRFREMLDRPRSTALGVSRLGEATEVLAQAEATDDWLGIIAGAVLQVGKQALSYRYGAKKPVLMGVRTVMSLPVVDVIWDGRNHALHWEETSPRPPVVKLLDALRRATGYPVEDTRNNSELILRVLEWGTEEDASDELRTLVTLP